MNTSIARYALGIAALVIIFGSLAVASVALRRRVLEEWTGAPARLAEVVIGLAVLVAIVEVLGAVGWFRLGPVTAVCVVAAWAIWRWSGPPVMGSRRRGFEPAGPGWTVGVAGALAIAGAAAVAAEWGALTIQSYNVGIRGFDSLWYHLPWAASYAQTGNIVSLRFTDVEYLTPFYPATAEVLHGLGIVLLGRDTVSPGSNLLWLGLLLLAAYCVGRPRGAGPAALLGAVVAMATSMMDYSQAGSAANDVVAVFFLLAAVAMLMEGVAGGETGFGRHQPHAVRPAVIVLAAIAAGLAVGVKLTVVAPVVALTVGVVAVAPRGRRLATAGLWLGPLILAGGFWYARNLIAVGNPLPWTSLGFLPTPAPPLQQHTGFSIAHYAIHGAAHLWSGFFEPGLASGLGRWWWAVVAAAVIGQLLCLVPERVPVGRNYAHMGVSSQALVRTLGVVSLVSLAAYVITPESAAGSGGDPLGFAFNLRYSAPALTLSLVVLPLAPAFAGPARQFGLSAALGALFVATVAQRQLWPSQHALGAIVIAAVVVLAALVWWAARPAPSGSRRHPRRLAPAVLPVAVLIVIAAGAGYRLQGHYLRGRYAYQPGVSYLSRVWAMFRTVHHTRVGLVGTFGGFFSYPLFGLDLSNRVQYVAQRGPHGSFTPIATCQSWRTAVNAGDFGYLVTTPARDPWHPRVLSYSPETRWTAADPAARPVFSELALGQPITVFRIDGPLNPAGCVS